MGIWEGADPNHSQTARVYTGHTVMWIKCWAGIWDLRRAPCLAAVIVHHYLDCEGEKGTSLFT